MVAALDVFMKPSSVDAIIAKMDAVKHYRITAEMIEAGVPYPGLSSPLLSSHLITPEMIEVGVPYPYLAPA